MQPIDLKANVKTLSDNLTQVLADFKLAHSDCNVVNCHLTRDNTGEQSLKVHVSCDVDGVKMLYTYPEDGDHMPA